MQIPNSTTALSAEKNHLFDRNEFCCLQSIEVDAAADRWHSTSLGSSQLLYARIRQLQQLDQ